eukprot:PLAT14876.1.p2 GENE.PLAT14876.1~~PLAT14876.1.p2  ORF type:complete len:154 (-),score=47.13 PLAT14876.1:784-1245(-)
MESSIADDGDSKEEEEQAAADSASSSSPAAEETEAETEAESKEDEGQQRAVGLSLTQPRPMAEALPAAEAVAPPAGGVCPSPSDFSPVLDVEPMGMPAPPVTAPAATAEEEEKEGAVEKARAIYDVVKDTIVAGCKPAISVRPTAASHTMHCN